MKYALILGLIVVGGFIGFKLLRLQPPSTQVAQLSTSPTPQNQVENVIQSSPDTAALRAGGSSYLDSQEVFGFLYPSDYTLDQQDGDRYTRITKRGATQQGQTEIYDGVLVVFERVELGDLSLNAWVDAQIQQSTADSSFDLTQAKKPITLNGYPGFSYEIRSLGTSKYIVVQKDSQSDFAVSITSLVADPQNIGYQAEVDAILSTLKLEK